MKHSRDHFCYRSPNQRTRWSRRAHATAGVAESDGIWNRGECLLTTFISRWDLVIGRLSICVTRSYRRGHSKSARRETAGALVGPPLGLHLYIYNTRAPHKRAPLLQMLCTPPHPRARGGTRAPRRSSSRRPPHIPRDLLINIEALPM